MNSAAAWATILLLWIAVMAWIRILQNALDRRRERRFADHTEQALAVVRHPELTRYTCELCGDTQILHPDAHFRLVHRSRATGPEDHDDWGAA